MGYKKVRHLGIRPEYKLVDVSKGKGTSFEEILPNGSFKCWNKKLLTSGCKKVLSEVIVRDDLIYCNHCDEWFSVNQFNEE